MKATDLLKDQEAIKLALAFKKIAKEYKISIPEMVGEGKRITELMQKNRTDAISLAPMIKKLIQGHEPDVEKQNKMLSLMDSMNITGSPKVFTALVLAFFFASVGALTEE